MTVNIKRSDLLALATACADLADPKLTPMARLSADSSTLEATATDRENWITLRAECDGELPPTYVDAARLREVVAGMRGDVLTIKADETSLHLSSKGGGKRKIMTSVATYPNAPAVNGSVVQFDSMALREAIAFTSPTMSDTFANLTGVHIHLRDGSYYAAATDRNGLAVCGIGAGDTDIAATVTDCFIKMLKHAPDEESLRMTFAPNMVRVEWPSGAFTSTIISQPFLPYMKIVGDHDHAMKVRGAELIDTMRAVSATASDDISKSKRVLLVADGGDVALQSRSQQGEADQPVDADWDGGAIAIPFVTGRMEKLLRGFGDDELEIGMTAFEHGSAASPKPIVIRSTVRNDRFAVLMPLKFF